jgi:hypothetical protein
MAEPAFEIHSGPYVMAIYADGKVELLQAARPLPRDSKVIINRIPQMLAKAANASRLSTFCTGA